jgi:hypothetical protein
MPLTRAPGIAKVDLNKVVFPMRDTASDVTVECAVSEDALRKLLGGGSSITSKSLRAITTIAGKHLRGSTIPRSGHEEARPKAVWA